MNMDHDLILESDISIISQGTRLEGKIHFDRTTRVHGVLVGEVHSNGHGGKLILSETSVVEGNIIADTVLIDGFVRGNIQTHGKVTISRTGRVIGDISTPKLELEFGGYFEGKCSMGTSTGGALVEEKSTSRKAVQ